MDRLVQLQRDYFDTNETKSYDHRLDALKRLRKSIRKNQNEISKALYKDLQKSEFESYATEIGVVLGELSTAIRKLKSWMRREKHSTPLIFFHARSYVVNEPYGVVLIIAPWNYPFQLLMAPLVGAIAAGNCVIIKPSQEAPATSRIMTKIIRDCFEEQFVAITEENNETTDRLLECQFDYIFYTGGVSYGKYVLKAAAENLTPVTLELGGKSPCIVEEDANLAIAARRIVWGKFLNCGQTCVAPDYIMVHTDVKEELITLLCSEIETQFGSEIQSNPDYPRIINKRRFNRLLELMEGETILAGGESDEKDLYIAPTLLDDITPDSLIMQEEIFGPLLPIIEYDDIEEVISYVKSGDKPLALYYFTEDRMRADELIEKTSSGGCAINDVVVQVANGHIPFGGVGNSGMGAYHGKYSFDTFSHKRGVMHSSTKTNIGVKFAPYGKKVSLLKRFMR
ncbi:MAG: aldehyde dehydrogenase [Rikenellaceae bacterium]